MCNHSIPQYGNNGTRGITVITCVDHVWQNIEKIQNFSDPGIKDKDTSGKKDSGLFLYDICGGELNLF